MREIDGGLTHLQWREAVIPVPLFSDTVSNLDVPLNMGLMISAPVSQLVLVCFQRTTFQRSRHPHPGRDVCDMLHREPVREREDHSARPEKLVAEKDDSGNKQCFPISHAEKDGGEDAAIVKDGGEMESTGDSTTVWSSVELNMQDIHPNRGQSCVHM